MIVCIAEKPSVARDIAHILGANTQHQGYYEGNGYQVTWTFGHLCELKYPEDYTPMWKRWSLGALPMVPPRFGIRLKNDSGVQKQFAVIQGLMAGAERIVNCGDAGQEGELIQRWVMQKAGATCPVDRLWISSLTEESIREGFSTLRPQDDYKSLYEAGLCRAIGDWLLGMNATRLYTLKYGGARGPGCPPLSIGRVQTPTLALIVRRQAEIENFVPEPYWVLTTQYRDTTFNAVMADPNSDETDAPTDAAGDKKKTPAAPARRGFTTEEEGRAALERIKDVPFTVNSVEKKNGTEAPPRLFDLTSLQVDCNRKFGYSADLTLSLIQALYEKKVTTYPRVDTTYLSDDIYPKCKGILNGISGQYGELLQPLRGTPLLKRKKVFDTSKVTDHHAIIPTGVAAQNLTDMERNVYDLVVRRFIQCFYPDCKFATTTVLGQAADVPFRASGKVILESGWRVVAASAAKPATTADDDERKDDSERTLPDFVRGESGPHRPDLAQKMTQPPKPYTEATLLRAMETAGRMVDNEELRDALKENGIGRPSTRAAIIETLFKRQYIRRQRKVIVATPTGVELISLIKEDLLKSAELTGQWERKLRLIEQHNYSPAQFIDELKAMVSDIVRQVLSDNSNRHVSAATPSPVSAKSSSAKGVSSSLKVSSASATSASASSGGESPAKPRKRIIRAGSVCPQCGQGKVIKGKTAYGCSRWKEGCDWRKPFK